MPLGDDVWFQKGPASRLWRKGVRVPPHGSDMETTGSACALGLSAACHGNLIWQQVSDACFHNRTLFWKSWLVRGVPAGRTNAREFAM